ncbi:hypothetical protein ACA910_015881 [Epithemia clementina (nom. ined.)]
MTKVGKYRQNGGVFSDPKVQRITTGVGLTLWLFVVLAFSRKHESYDEFPSRIRRVQEVNTIADERAGAKRVSNPEDIEEAFVQSFEDELHVDTLSENEYDMDEEEDDDELVEDSDDEDKESLGSSNDEDRHHSDEEPTSEKQQDELTSHETIRVEALKE